MKNVKKSAETQYNKEKVSVKLQKKELSFNHEYYLTAVIILEFRARFGCTYPYEILQDRKHSLLEIIGIGDNLNIISAISEKSNDIMRELTKIIYLSLVNLLALTPMLDYFNGINPISNIYISQLMVFISKNTLDLSPLSKLINSTESLNKLENALIKEMLDNINQSRKDLLKYINNILDEYTSYIYSKRIGLFIGDKYPKLDYLGDITAITDNHWDDAHYIKKLFTMPVEELQEILSIPHLNQFETYKRTLELWVSMIHIIKYHVKMLLNNIKDTNTPRFDFKILKFNINDIIKSKTLITMNPSVFTAKSQISNNQFTKILFVLDNMTRTLLLLIAKEYKLELSTIALGYKL